MCLAQNKVSVRVFLVACLIGGCAGDSKEVAPQSAAVSVEPGSATADSGDSTNANNTVSAETLPPSMGAAQEAGSTSETTDQIAEPASVETDSENGNSTPAVLVEELEVPGNDFWANLDAAGVVDARSGVFAFPGAVGFGKQSIGGRGGRVFCVNTLEDINVDGDGKISYREAVTGINEVDKGSRIVTFCVSGVVDTGEDRVLILHGNLTVACQTAPGPGVVITGYRPVDIDNDADNQIWRHCDIKPRDTLDPGKNVSQRLVTIGGGPGVAPDHLIFDHMSLMYSTDDSFLIFVNRDPATTVPSNITLSHSIIAEGDTTCLRTDFECGNAESRRTDTYGWPNHSMGPAVASHNGSPVSGVSMIANVIGNTNARNPQFRGVSPGEIANNLIFNVHSAGIWISSPANSAPNDVFIEGNIIKDGPDDRNTDRISYNSDNTRVAVNGNTRVSWQGEITNDYMGNARQTLESVERAYLDGMNKLDLTCVGSSQPARDSEDERIIAETNGAGLDPVLGSAEVGIGPRVEPIVPPCVAGAWCFYEPSADDQGQRDYSSYSIGAAHPETYDADNDGIADDWERAAIAADTSGNLTSISEIDYLTDSDNDGYLDVEEWLNHLALCGE